MLSREEWMTVAERRAAQEYGKKYAKLFAFRRFAAGPLGIAVVLGGLGYGCWWAWSHLTAGGLHFPPAWLLLLLVVTAGGTVLALRMPAFSTGGRIVKAFVVVAVWLGLLAFSSSYLLG